MDVSAIRDGDRTTNEGRALTSHPNPGMDNKNHAGRQLGFALMIDAVEFREIQADAVPRTELGKVLEPRRGDDTICCFKYIGNPRSGHRRFHALGIGSTSNGENLPLAGRGSAVGKYAADLYPV